VTIALPLFGAADAEVARARAAEGRAEAELAAARREGAVTLVLAERTRDLAARRLEADREAVRHATRVAQLSATAYREGAYPIATVLEAQRNARDALRRYIDDLIASRTAAAAYRLAVIAGGPTP
jgi:outer membrane protein TolC